MKVRRFSISSYLAEGEACHVARRALAPRWPEHAHDHDYVEVFLVERGTAEHWINGTQAQVAPGDLVFIRPGDAHAFRADGHMECEIFNVMFRPQTARAFRARYPAEFRGRLFDHPGPAPQVHRVQGARLARARESVQALSEAPRSQARLDAFLLALANEVVAPVAGPGQSMPQWLAEACEAARDPQVFRLGAPGFIAVAGRSHEHVCRTCQTALGLTPSALVNRIRIEFAAERLAHSNDPIPEIAAQCGIENISHFYRVFRTHRGTTPRSYRLRHQRAPF